MRSVQVDSIIYGPVPSWRLGRSLGVDLVSTTGKTCSFDCIYCQLGRTIYQTAKRAEFVSIDQLAREMEPAQAIPVDYVTFSGVAEPTLASNLAEGIELVKTVLGHPVAVLTNSSLMMAPDVRHDLTYADTVVAKLDAPTEDRFRHINRPVKGISLEQIIKGIKEFRLEYQGRLALQMMFVEENRHHVSQMVEVARQISPDEVQLNTPLRPCAVKPLSPEEMRTIQKAFSGLREKVVMVYDAPKPVITPMNITETLRRRPQL